MLRTIILEDEPEILQSLEFIVNNYCNQLNHIGSATTLKQGGEIIRKYLPDLVLLDIVFPDGNAFDFLESLEKVDFKIIFITAFNEYAIDAFRFSAVDYLLKPISHEDLQNAVKKAEDLDSKEKADLKLQILLKAVKDNNEYPDKLVLHTKTEFHIVDLSDVIFLEADRNKTNFYLKNNKVISIHVQFNEYVGMLRKNGFVKVHRCYLVNLDEVKSFFKKDGGYLIMNNDAQIPVSSSKRDELLRLMG